MFASGAHNNSEVGAIALFYKGARWGLEWLNKLTKISQLENGRVGTHSKALTSKSRVLTINKLLNNSQ